MTFIQSEFLILFAVVFGLYWFIPRRAQNYLLLLSSVVFYGWVHPWFLFLLFGSAILDYNMGQWMAKTTKPSHRKLALIISMCGNLGLLGFFKYTDFMINNVAAIITALGLQANLNTLGIILPVGISFYTFQTMSYSIDVYRKQLEPRKDLVDYMVFVSFFPQLVAGPVERAANLLKQVEQNRILTKEKFRSGLSLAFWGAVKKVMVADTIAPYVDKVFTLNNPSTLLVGLATIGFAIQILADFSGYTDIARGISRMLGFELVKNFDHPYLAKNPSQLWRRWHISFSSWIRDYLFIPFGGSKGTFWLTTKATFGAMLLSGLWHGASWNFVIWGGYHAALITGYRLVTKRIPKPIREKSGIPAVIIMFGFTSLGWLFFRETHLDRIIQYFTQNPLSLAEGELSVALALTGILIFTSLPMIIALVFEKIALPKLEFSNWLLPVQTTGWALAVILIAIFYRPSGGDFIYFQF